MVDFTALRAEFPKSAIHWRAQTVTRDGSKAMALAYLDSRDVQDRLDEVCGPENWQTIHYDCGDGKLACKIGIRIGDDWVWKSDGAGSTDIEAEKGAFSSAFKRAAVLLGVGRYLYDLPAPWVPCETYKDGNGKPKFKRFAADPWEFCTPPKGQSKPVTGPYGTQELQKKLKELCGEIENWETVYDHDVFMGRQDVTEAFNQAERDLPQWMHGDGEAKKGILGLVQKRLDEVRQYDPTQKG